MSTTFTIGTHNTNHGAAVFRPFADLIGWQEVDNPSATRRLHRTMRAAGWGTVGLAHECPISFRDRDWHLHYFDVQRVHNGLAGVSPSRFITAADIEHKKTGLRPLMINTHMVSGAFNANTQEKAEKWRDEMWERHYQMLQDICRDNAGKIVLLVGDLNRQRGFGFHGLERADHGSVDHIWVDATAEVVDHDQLSRFGSDHPAERAKVRVP